MGAAPVAAGEGGGLGGHGVVGTEGERCNLVLTTKAFAVRKDAIAPGAAQTYVSHSRQCQVGVAGLGGRRGGHWGWDARAVPHYIE